MSASLKTSPPSSARQLAIEHWNQSPLFVTEEARYALYPWLYEAAEFRHHLQNPGRACAAPGRDAGSGWTRPEMEGR